jgi:flagellar hook-associated protein 1 FlgK
LNEFQNLANDPSSLSERQIVVSKAAQLATQFNQTDGRIAAVQNALNGTLNGDVTQANQLLADIAKLNQEIGIAQTNGGAPNDLLDTRQDKIEQLSELIKVDVSSGSNGALNISVNGTSLVTDIQVADTLETYDAGSGQLLLRTQTGGVPLNPVSGAMQGIIAVRDGALADVRSSINSLAATLISEVNQIHTAGYGLADSTGANFFNGSSAADIQVNNALLNNPSLVQASGAAGAPGDNQTALALAQLSSKSIAGLSNQTFNQSYTQAVTALGQAAASINCQVDDQKVVTNMLTKQRQSLSGVSLDEEMANMLTYQRAYQASSKIITTVDEMLSTLINMKQP